MIGAMRRSGETRQNGFSDMTEDANLDREGVAVPWDAVRRDYEAGHMTCNGIAHRYKLRRGQLDGRAKTSKWLRPGRSEDIDRRLLVAKALALLEKQMDLLEEKLDKGGPADSKVLSGLVRDIDKLIAMESREIQRGGPTKGEGEASELRRKLEARINAITKGRI
jgi:hypothetical protein